MTENLWKSNFSSKSLVACSLSASSMRSNQKTPNTLHQKWKSSVPPRPKSLRDFSTKLYVSETLHHQRLNQLPKQLHHYHPTLLLHFLSYQLSSQCNRTPQFAIIVVCGHRRCLGVVAVMFGVRMSVQINHYVFCGIFSRTSILCRLVLGTGFLESTFLHFSNFSHSQSIAGMKDSVKQDSILTFF